MSQPQKLNRTQVSLAAIAARLDLSAERLDALVNSYSDFLTKFQEIWEFELGDREPPAITFTSEYPT